MLIFSGHSQKREHYNWEEESTEFLPSLAGRGSKLIIPWCLEAEGLIDNHRTALRVYIAIKQRDKGGPKALITVVTLAKPDQPLAYSCLTSGITGQHSA